MTYTVLKFSLNSNHSVNQSTTKLESWTKLETPAPTYNRHWPRRPRAPLSKACEDVV